MFQIDNGSVAPVQPASTTSGTPGFFTDGNPAVGVPATILPAEFMNTLMLELLNVLAAAGVTPAKTKFDQLATSIQALSQVGASSYAADSGAANAYVAAFTPPVTALTDGMILKYKAANANTGASTFSPNGLGARPIVGGAHAALQGGEIAPNGDVWLQYSSSIDAGSWVLIDSTGGALQVAPATQSHHAVPLGQVPTETLGGAPLVATQSQTNSGVDDTTIVTPKKFSAGIAALVVQATELISGIAKVATQALVNAGADDATMVTPKKLRSGFSMQLSTNGWIQLPSWMGGLILQWGVANVPASTTSSFSLPMAFPNQALASLVQSGTLSMIAGATPGGASTPVGLTGIQIQNTYSASPINFTYFILGK